MSKALLYDATLCIGCKQCEQACAEQNKLPYNDTVAAEEVQSAHKYTVVLNKNEKFMRRLCMNCNDPSCASVCPVGAFKKTKEGPVVYEASRCMGCRYCLLACPFGVPKYEWEKALPLVRKCTMCGERVTAGKQTACAEACPTGATKFGDRDELLDEARQRIRQEPGKYVAHIFGEHEVGGTSVLMLSSVPFEQFGFNTELPREPLPMLTYRVLERVPDFVPLGGILLGGIYWITHRREEVALAESKLKLPPAKPEKQDK